MVFSLAACGGKQAEPEIKEWTRQGYYADENGNMLSVTWMEDIDEPGWYVGVSLGDYWGGATLPQEGNSLHGRLNTWYDAEYGISCSVSVKAEDLDGFDLLAIAEMLGS